jgi:hypothetical protein
VTDPADFLSRWSRRKRKAAKALPDSDAGQAQDDALKSEADKGADVPPQVTATDKKKPPTRAETKPEEPVFDIAKLPSIESITAETDIRAFLSPGVPAALRQAALRQAWSADPKIRDFIEMAENQFDFNSGGEILGFDFSAPTGDIRRMVSDILGKDRETESETEAQPETAGSDGTAPGSVPTEQTIAAHRNVTQTVAGVEQRAVESPSTAHIHNDAVRQTQCETNIATQNNDASQDQDNSPGARRSHGGAMPK